MRVRANPVESEQGLGLDILVTDEQATVEDLVQAYAAASDDEQLAKLQRSFPTVEPHGTCFGCTYCCHRFSIFLARLDVLRLATGEGVSPEEFIAFCTAYEPWKVDRLRLVDPASYCLREDDLGCGKYLDRPLICRLFICCPHTDRARQLIGEVNRWAEEDLVNWRFGRVDTDNPFTDKFAYAQVLLKDCVSSELWQQLYQPEHSWRPVA